MPKETTTIGSDLDESSAIRNEQTSETRIGRMIPFERSVQNTHQALHNKDVPAVVCEMILQLIKASQNQPGNKKQKRQR